MCVYVYVCLRMNSYVCVCVCVCVSCLILNPGPHVSWENAPHWAPSPAWWFLSLWQKTVVGSLRISTHMNKLVPWDGQKGQRAHSSKRFRQPQSLSTLCVLTVCGGRPHSRQRPCFWQGHNGLGISMAAALYKHTKSCCHILLHLLDFFPINVCSRYSQWLLPKHFHACPLLEV